MIKPGFRQGILGRWGRADELRTQKAQTASPEFWGLRRDSDVKGRISDALRRRVCRVSLHSQCMPTGFSSMKLCWYQFHVFLEQPREHHATLDRRLSYIQ